MTPNIFLVALALVALALSTTQVFSDATGSFGVDYIEYADNMDETWVINVDPLPETVELRVSGETEANSDIVSIYKASCTSSGTIETGTSTQVGESLSGDIMSVNVSVDLDQTYNCVYVNFQTNDSFSSYDGFEVEYCTDDTCTDDDSHIVALVLALVAVVAVGGALIYAGLKCGICDGKHSIME
ncbi:hypothetical protein KIPB_001483 [Kipferlia bialata]|uniref:Uncharacterized protein n=1 Tax=Kipferlia bialata TaxID=797122 RepID=A0A9K3GFA6_9EUKA|nr:hypothetical protein KIPB_001483 [Kipferlia bialata]|eukprot:g1483.t1